MTSELARAEAERDALQAFKDYVHRRLDEAGIPANPQPPKHALEGCRIGDRLDTVIGERDAARGALAALAAAIDAFNDPVCEDPLCAACGSCLYDEDAMVLAHEDDCVLERARALLSPPGAGSEAKP